MNEALSSTSAVFEGAARELVDWSDKIEMLGATLCVDADIVAVHFEQLQGLDLLAQTLKELAKVIASPDPMDAAQKVCVHDLQQRLIEAGRSEASDIAA